MTWSFRSGWCSLDAQPWQHARCAGSYDGAPCVCPCHASHPKPVVDQALVELVERRDISGLVDDLQALAGRPGEWPPSVQKVKAAALELLGEVTR